MKYFPHHLFKRSKNCKTSVENFYFVYPFSEKNSAILPKLIKPDPGAKLIFIQLRLTRVLSFVGWSGTRSALSEEGFNSLKGCELKNKYPLKIK